MPHDATLSPIARRRSVPAVAFRAPRGRRLRRRITARALIFSVVASCWGALLSTAAAAPFIYIQSVARYEGNTGTRPLDFVVSLTEISDVPVSVDYETRDGTASAAKRDFVPAGGRLVFFPGSWVDTIVVSVNGDSTFETDETLKVVLLDPVNATITVDTGIGTIQNDDSRPTVFVDDVRQREGNQGETAFQFMVRLSRGSVDSVRVNFATEDVTAHAGTDYRETHGTLVFDPETRAATIIVPVKGDAEEEPDETFFVRLTSPRNATIGDGTGIGTIVNEDPVVPPIVRLLEPNGGEILRFGDPGWISWSATGMTDSVTSVALRVSVNGGATFDSLAGPLPNSGSFFWDPVMVVTGMGPGPVFSALIQVTVFDAHGLQGIDTSDGPFAIQDQPARLATRMTLDALPAQPTCAERVTLRASIVPETASGAIDFFDGPIHLGGADLEGGPVEIAVTSLAAGAHAITAIYRGDSTHRSGRTVTSLDVARSPVVAMLRLVPDSPTCGALVSLELFLTPDSAHGTARLYDGPALLGTAEVSRGRVSMPVPGIRTGEHAFRADFAGDACYLSASDALSAVVDRGPTQVEVTSTPNPAKQGDPAILTAFVTPASATGIVEFREGDASLGSESITGGRAVMFVLFTDSGERAITAAYSGDACFVASQSPATIVVVGSAPQLSIGDASTLEGDCASHFIEFPVALSSPSTREVSVGFATESATATPASLDFVAASGRLTFTPGVTRRDIPIQVFGDGRFEGDETFRVVLRDPQIATILNGSGEGTILDDDPAGSVGEEPPHFIQQWVSQDVGPLPFSPSSLAIVESLGLVVADTENQRVQLTSLKGVFRRSFPVVDRPLAIAFDTSGNLFTLGQYQSKVRKWSPSGELLEVFGGLGSEPGRFSEALDIAVGRNGHVHITDAGGCVHEFTNEGAFVRTWGCVGARGIACDNDRGWIYLSTSSHRIHRYASDGASSISWGGLGGEPCQFNSPQGLDIDQAGNVYVADAFNARIQKFTAEGALVALWGTRGSSEGQFLGPWDVAVDSAGQVYVGDRANHRIQKFGPPDRIAPRIECPADTTIACGPSGVVVTFAPTVEDDQDPTPRVECVPAAGSFFQSGTTRVTCTAIDRDGNSDSCGFDVRVMAADCAEVSRVRIDEIALACANGDTTVQFLELVATGPGQAFSGGLLLRAYDRNGAVRLEQANLFPGAREGDPWQEGVRWLIGTAGFAGAAMTPDVIIPADLDHLAGAIAILSPTAEGYRVIHEVAYGMAGGPDAPLPGRSLVRASDDVMVENPTPSPVRHDGTTGVLSCPCGLNRVSDCSGNHTSTNSSFSHSDHCPDHQSSGGGYDLRTGSLHAHGGEGSGFVSAQDVYYLGGIRAGTPITFAILYRMNMGSYHWFGSNGGGGSISLGDSLQATASNSGPPRDTTLRLNVRLPAHQPFRLSLSCHAWGAEGSGSASARLAFAELPPGVRVTSCQGFSGDVLVPVTISLESADADDGLVRLRWYGASMEGRRVTVQRRQDSQAWFDRGEAAFDGEGRLVFEDRDVVATRRYAYRVAWLEGDTQVLSPESWVTIPAAASLALEAPRPNPTSGEIQLRFRLRGGRPAQIRVLDVAGREVFARDLRDLGAGVHALVVSRERITASGLYFVRLVEGNDGRTARVLVVR